MSDPDNGTIEIEHDQLAREEQVRLWNERYSLKRFLTENDKIFPPLSLFTALTVFSRTIDMTAFASSLAFLFLVTTTLMYFELRSHFPDGLKLEWKLDYPVSRVTFLRSHLGNRLAWFSVLLDFSILALALYTVYEFWYLWGGITMGILLVVALHKLWVIVHGRASRSWRGLARVSAYVAERTWLNVLIRTVFLALCYWISFGLLGHLADDFGTVSRIIVLALRAATVVLTVLLVWSFRPHWKEDSSLMNRITSGDFVFGSIGDLKSITEATGDPLLLIVTDRLERVESEAGGAATVEDITIITGSRPGELTVRYARRDQGQLNPQSPAAREQTEVTG